MIASAPVLSAQAQQGGTRHRKPAQSYATAAGASYAQDPSKQSGSAAGNYSGYDINNPWVGPRTCY